MRVWVMIEMAGGSGKPDPSESVRVFDSMLKCGDERNFLVEDRYDKTIDTLVKEVGEMAFLHEPFDDLCDPSSGWTLLVRQVEVE